MILSLRIFFKERKSVYFWLREVIPPLLLKSLFEYYPTRPLWWHMRLAMLFLWLPKGGGLGKSLFEYSGPKLSPTI